MNDPAREGSIPKSWDKKFVSIEKKNLENASIFNEITSNICGETDEFKKSDIPFKTPLCKVASKYPDLDDRYDRLAAEMASSGYKGEARKIRAMESDRKNAEKIVRDFSFKICKE